jgi:hypothetical protein
METMTTLPTKVPTLDPLAALVGGAGVFVAHLISLRPLGLSLGDPYGLIGAVALFIGLSALAFGLPGFVGRDPEGRRRAERGLVGANPIARWALVASGALALLGAVGNVFFPRDLGDVFSSGALVYGAFLSWLGFAQIIALVVAAVFVSTSAGATRGVRIGLRLLAVAAVAGFVLTLFPLVIQADALQSFADAAFWLYGLFEFVACAAGVVIAWPWLAPFVDRAFGSASRARDRWVDTTP